MATQPAFSFLLPLSFLSVMAIASSIKSSEASASSAIFVFGDSIVDVGNNNFLPNPTVRANFPPNGIDFPHAAPTGRFSNGFNAADFLSKLLGYPQSPPPFLSLKSTSLAKQAGKGINFASAGSGINQKTGNTKGQALSLGRQIELFETVCAILTAEMGGRPAASLLSSSFFIISSGSNDLFSDYAANGPSNASHKVELISGLVLSFKAHISKLYNLGARKIAVIGLAPVGCCPSMRAANPTGCCIEDLNESARLFHESTKDMLMNLSSQLTGLKFALGNTFFLINEAMRDQHRFGLEVDEAACCGGGRFKGQYLCSPVSEVCSNRDDYLFWDMFHVTQAAANISAEYLWYGSQELVNPVNFRQLAAS